MAELLVNHKDLYVQPDSSVDMRIELECKFLHHWHITVFGKSYSRNHQRKFYMPLYTASKNCYKIGKCTLHFVHNALKYPWQYSRNTRHYISLNMINRSFYKEISQKISQSLNKSLRRKTFPITEFSHSFNLILLTMLELQCEMCIDTNFNQTYWKSQMSEKILQCKKKSAELRLLSRL